MSTASADNTNDEQFISIGSYAPPDAERLLDALRRASIKFEIECDDGIRGGGSKFGDFGQYAKIRVFVDRKQIPEVKDIQIRLFGE